MNIRLHQVSKNQADNRQVLAEGVEGIQCTFVGDVSTMSVEMLEYASHPLKKIASLLAGQRVYIGTVEVYANGALNVFVRDVNTGMATGIYTLRLE